MQLTHPRRAPWLALLLAALVGALAIVPATATAARGAARPQLLTPKSGAAVALGSQPTFKVKDLGRPYADAVYLTVARSKRKDQFGRLSDYDHGGTMTKMVAGARKRWTYVPPRYTFAEWFTNKAGTWYWQAYHVTGTGDYAFSKLGRFTVG